MINFCSHRDVWERQVGEKEEGGSVCVLEKETKWDSGGI